MGLAGLSEILTRQLSWLPRELFLLAQKDSELEGHFAKIAPYLRVKESRFFVSEFYYYLRFSLAQ